MPTLKTLTLGCKVNQYETEYIRQGLSRLGYREPAPGQAADLCVVNTCSVTAEADRKSRKLIRQLARENPGTKIIVMGCYATRQPERVAALAGVTDVVTDKRRLPDLLARFGLGEIPSGISSFGRRSRAYVKIQDGCRMECTYCIIPQTRPVLQSRPIDEVLDEIRRLVEHGYREIVLTGIHLGHYGVDLAAAGQRVAEVHEGVAGAKRSAAPEGGRGTVPFSRRENRDSPQPNLADLLRHVVRLDGTFRVRISSIEAAELPDELLAVIAEHPDRVCPHLHVSMQSGSDAVLRRMRRRQSSSEFLQQCERIKQRLDRPALTTDVMVGFPGETEADFKATCRAVEAVGFSKIHVFRFSARPGTAAAEMADTVPGDVQRQRAAELAQIEKCLRSAYFESLLGRKLEVLIESAATDRPATLLGTSARYVPVELPGPTHQVGHLVRAVARTVVDGRVRAEAIATR